MSASRPEPAKPNVVLRGGPLDGNRLHVDTRGSISVEAGDERVIYRPSIELDDEYPTLTIWVFDHATPV